MDLFTNLATGFAVALTPANLGFCFLGALIGTLVGVLPGIAPITTIAILLPFTFALPPASLLGHLVPVEARHDGRGLARHIDEDRGGGAAVLGAVENTGEHDQRGGGRQRERERQQDRDGGDRCDAGQHADQRADQRAEKAEAEIGRRQRNREAGGEIGDQVHAGAPLAAQGKHIWFAGATCPLSRLRERVASECEPGEGSCCSAPLPPRLRSGPSPRHSPSKTGVNALVAGRGDQLATPSLWSIIP